MIIEHENLNSTDLIPGMICLGGVNGNLSDEPISKLFKLNHIPGKEKYKGIGNMSGIRSTNIISSNEPAFIVLVDRNDEPLWPNNFDSESGVLTYYGDNKIAQEDIFNTKQKGNLKLKKLFDEYIKSQILIYPVFYFKKVDTKSYTYVGLCYPIYYEIDETNQPIKNLVFKFKVDTNSIIDRRWLYDLKDGQGQASKYVPQSLNNINNLYNEIFGSEETDTKKIDELTSFVLEGKMIATYTTKYERNNNLRRIAIKYHGTTCKACSFNFGSFYGDYAEDYIEVHHIKPLFLERREHSVDPKTDLVPLCSNCHRMIHKKRSSIISVDELKNIIKKHKL